MKGGLPGWMDVRKELRMDRGKEDGGMGGRREGVKGGWCAEGEKDG